MQEARWVFIFLGAMALMAMAMPAVRAADIDAGNGPAVRSELAGEHNDS